MLFYSASERLLEMLGSVVSYVDDVLVGISCFPHEKYKMHIIQYDMSVADISGNCMDWVGSPTIPPPKYANKLTVISTHSLHYITGRNVLTICCRKYCKGHHKWFISELSNEITCHSDP